MAMMDQAVETAEGGIWIVNGTTKGFTSTLIDSPKRAPADSTLALSSFVYHCRDNSFRITVAEFCTGLVYESRPKAGFLSGESPFTSANSSSDNVDGVASDATLRYIDPLPVIVIHV